MEIFRSAETENALKRAAHALGGLIEEGGLPAEAGARAGETPVLVLFSGGSSHTILQFLQVEGSWRNRTISVLDERLSADPQVNNFLQIAGTAFFARAMHAGARVIDTSVVEGETAEGLARRMEGALRAWRAAHPAGRVFATMGIGRDGHTAGIMRYPEDAGRFAELFEDPERWVTGYDAGDKNPHPLRATATLPFLRREVDAAVVYVSGEEKRGALLRTLAEEGALYETPARILREMKRVLLSTDIV